MAQITTRAGKPSDDELDGFSRLFGSSEIGGRARISGMNEPDKITNFDGLDFSKLGGTDDLGGADESSELSSVDDSMPLANSGAAQNEIFKHNTISEDQSAGSDLPSRLLLAISQRGDADRTYQLLEDLPRTRPLRKIDNTMIEAGVRGSLGEVSGMFTKSHPALRQQSRYFPPPPIFAHSRGNSPQSTVSGVPPDPQKRSNPMTQASADESKNAYTTPHVNTSAEKATQSLDNIDPSTQGLAELRQYIATLQGKAQQLEKLQHANVPKRYQILYNIMQGEDYLDHPEWVQGGSTIKSSRPLHNLDLYLERNKDISFLIHRSFYDKKRGTRQMIDYNTPSDCIKSENPDSPTPQREWIRPIARNLRDALDRVLQSRPEYVSLLEQYQQSGVVDAPYLFMYHGRSRWEKVLRGFSSSTRKQLKMFADYVFRYYGEEYDAARHLFSESKVSPAFMKYLFVPGEVLVSKKNSGYQGYMSKSWPNFSYRLADGRDGSSDDIIGANHLKYLIVKPHPKSDVGFSGDDDNLDFEHAVPQWNKPRHKSARSQEDPGSCSIKTWRWAFDTKFKKQHEVLIVNFPRSKSDESFHNRPIRIEELETYPLRFASEAVVEQLKHRGKIFWKCRERCLVSYVEQEGEIADDRSDERYMIDQKTFQVLNPSNSGFKLPAAINSDDELSPDQLERDELPDKNFQYLLPLTIKGYNLRRKKWYDIAVDRISPVVWNKQVFETLVMDRKPKDLIQALISKQVASQKSTDLIAGKGNGLILLLHGGPGTGKTLTAESVAEIAEKPLYRVTCGDVGTKAEDVEKYLESVLHLGKIWDCVVLLDEADVFLEQRSLEDLQRNALVSVFLRILEYHEGILILTSNRVGTFDEAFRSRIQLALHYPSLRSFQRQRIWEIFFNRLDSFKDDMVDISDLQDHLEELAKFEMNGRQIRNVITTARQYAEWKEKKLDYECLKDVIEISGKFDTYLNKLRGGMTYDQIAEDEGFR